MNRLRDRCVGDHERFGEDLLHSRVGRERLALDNSDRGNPDQRRDRIDRVFDEPRYPQRFPHSTVAEVLEITAQSAPIPQRVDDSVRSGAW
jgi:hypothetical protein